MFFTNTRTFYDDINDVYHMIRLNENTNNMLEFIDVDYLAIFQLCLSIMSILSILLLIDNTIPYYDDIYNKTNKVDTKKYPNIYSLILSETINYLSQIPNLITLCIGIIQFKYTAYISVMSLNPILNIIIIGVIGLLYIYYQNRYQKWLSIGLSIYLLGNSFNFYNIYLIRGKIVNLCVSTWCLIFSISREISMDSSSKKLDQFYNSSIIFSRKENKKVRADQLTKNEEIELYYNELTPSELEILEIIYDNPNEIIYDNPNGNILIMDKYQIDYDIGYYYDKETSGEDVSKLFRVGDIIPPHRKLTRPCIKIIGRVNKLIDTKEMKRKRSKNEALPHFLDTSWMITDIFAVCLLIILSISISISAIAYEGDPKRILKHIIATTISGNTLIPSMKMILLYNIYNFILRLCFSTITINRYQSLKDIEDVKQVIFDKTGTLTEELMYVDNKITHSNTILSNIEKDKVIGWLYIEIEFAISIANSESSINKNQVWGTSPEENYILHYWTKLGFQLLFNPLSNQKILEFQYNGGEIRKIEILERHPYCFELGKLSKIKLNNGLVLTIRQHGNDFFDKKNHINDIRRTMSIAILNKDNEWEVVTSYIFENPLRTNIKNVIDYLDNKNIKSGILTGDGREAAEYIGKNIGYSLDNIFRLDKTNMMILETNNMIKTVSISGDIINYYLHHNPELLMTLLNSKNYNKILYRVPNHVKQKIVKLIPKSLYIGDASNDALALKDAYIGVCLTHGADICKLNSDIIMDEPKYILDIMKQNGYKDMIIVGGQRLLLDICWFGGLVSGFLLTGIHINKFQFLQNSILYQDTWDTLTMMFISSFQYSFSVISYSSSDCSPNKITDMGVSIYSITNIICGLLLGLLISWFFKTINIFQRIDLVLLHSINIIMLIRHSVHCITSKKTRTYDGLFGNQRRGYNKSIIIFIMNILDSLPFRIVLYCIFFCFFPL